MPFQKGNTFGRLSKGHKGWNKGTSKYPIIHCLNCGKETRNKKFCSRKCSNQVNKNIQKISSSQTPWDKGLTKETSELLAQISRKISNTMKGRKPWNIGLTKETDERVRINGLNTAKTRRERIKTGKIVLWHKGKTKETDSRVAQISKSVSRTVSQQFLDGREVWNKGLTKDIDSRLECNDTTRALLLFYANQPKSIEFLENLHKRIREHWAKPEAKASHIKSILLAMKSRGDYPCPNKVEILLDNLLQDNFPNEWKFVGDGQIIIGGKVPDFININHRKQIIELFGNYWHRNSSPQDRINLFAQYGYATLIIWESELLNPLAVVKKIKEWQRI